MQVSLFSVFLSGEHQLVDSALLETFQAAGRAGGLVVVHGTENEEVVKEGERRMLAAGVTGPEGHAQVSPHHHHSSG